MKKIISGSLLLVLATASFSQQTEPTKLQSNTDYLRKSKTQKTFAWILTGAGVTAVTIGLLTQDYVEGFTDIAGEKNTASPAVYAAGGACIAGGIILFVASSKNRKKANAASVSVNMGKTPVLQTGTISNLYYPALELKVSFK